VPGLLAGRKKNPTDGDRSPATVLAKKTTNNDDEIIDRALGAQGLAGTAITFLTFDTNQAEKSRRAGLKVKKLVEPVGEEPEDPRHKERRQPEANGRST
jgi:hypothetical protein